jgi:hypothetical protein
MQLTVTFGTTRSPTDYIKHTLARRLASYLYTSSLRAHLIRELLNQKPNQHKLVFEELAVINGHDEPRRLRLPVPHGSRRRGRRRTIESDAASLDDAAARVRAPFPVLCLRQGVRVAPSARRAQGQPPKADGRASPKRTGAVRRRRRVFGNDAGQRAGEAQVLGVPPKILDGAGARRAQEVPLLGRAVRVTLGLRVSVFKPQRFVSQPDAGDDHWCDKVGRGGGAESLVDQEEADVGSFFGA